MPNVNAVAAMGKAPQPTRTPSSPTAAQPAGTAVQPSATTGGAVRPLTSSPSLVMDTLPRGWAFAPCAIGVG